MICNLFSAPSNYILVIAILQNNNFFIVLKAFPVNCYIYRISNNMTKQLVEELV